MNEMPPMAPSAEKPEYTEMSELSAEQIEMYEQYMKDNPDVAVSPEKKRECGPEIAQFEQLIDSFEATHSLEALHTLLTEEEAMASPERQAAKADLVPIVKLFNTLRDETDISDEQKAEIKEKYMHLSRAVGMINSGKVDHTR